MRPRLGLRLGPRLGPWTLDLELAQSQRGGADPDSFYQGPEVYEGRLPGREGAGDDPLPTGCFLNFGVLANQRCGNYCIVDLSFV